MSLDLIRSSSTVTKIVLFVIAIVFIFGFGYSFVNFGALGGGPQGTAAEVNGEEISLLQYYTARDNMLSRFDTGDEIPDTVLRFVRTRALNQLIDLKLISQKAREVGLKVTDDELKEAIISNPAFQLDGDFVGFAAYKNVVERGLNQSVGEFERGYKEELLAQKFIDFINETAKLSDEEIKNLYRIQNERIKLAYLQFTPDQYSDSIKIKDEEIAKHYNENKETYTHPQKREIEYIVIKPTDFEKNIEITEEERTTYYDSFKNEEFVDQDGNTKEYDSVKDEIGKILVNERKNFKRKEFTDNLDELSNTRSLAEIGKKFGIEKTLSSTFSLEESTADSAPLIVKNKTFELEKGDKFFTNEAEDIWIVNVKDIKQASQKSLEDAKDSVITDLKIIKGRELAEAQSNKILNDLVKNKPVLSELKDKYADQYQETDLFTRLDNVAEINSKEILLNSFLLDEKNPVSKEVYEIGDNYYILSLIEKKQIDESEFEQRKEEIRNAMIQRKRNEIYQNWILSIRKQANIKPNPNLFPEIG